ncbi:DnaJ-like protein [Archangium gephyra]|nr:helix-turn-helix domain-containing protein [Archangium gephyra]REG37593.1 DnaJ-like protein [Archangium gephyra]
MSAMKHFEQQSYYELLEVPVTASEDQILDAYARAMETYSPDSIAVYTLAEPEQLEALRQQLTQAMEVLCALEQRLEYDRKIGVKRSPEELARLRTESLKRAAEPTANPAAANGAGESPVPEAAAPAEPVAEVKPELQAQPAAEEEVLLEAEVVTEVEPVAGPEPVAEAKPTGQAPASEPPAAMAPPEPVAIAASAAQEAQAPARNEAASDAAAPSEPDAAPNTPAPAEPPPAAVPRVPLAAKPGSRSLTPAPVSGLKPAIHARPLGSMARHGAAVPPPLPPRNGARAPVRPEAESAARPAPPAATRPNGQQLGEAPVLAEASAIANAESALALVSAKARDSRTRLKTVVDIPSDAEFNGELLRQVREGRNLSLQMLADRTRISSRHVENIEADRYDILPASVYLRGMLMSIARELGLDPLRVSRSYMGLVASGEKKTR